jgi:hypothetical protein
MKNFKMVNKNSVGGAGLLLFFIVVSQARLFDFLIDTSLGRIFLILFLICLSYCHGILGVVGVLLIIIAFNHSGLSFLSEGFENTSTTATTPTAGDGTLKAKLQANPTAAAAVKAQIQARAAASGKTLPTTTTTDPTTTTTDPTTTTTDPTTTTTDPTTTDPTTTTTDSFVTTRGLEGFDVLGIENNLKRGKQSNSIPTSSYSKQDSDFISAYEGSSSIFGNFSLF